MHGVAYNAMVLPAVADIFRPITNEAITKLAKDANIILQDVSTQSTDQYTIASYASGKTILETFGSDARDAYNKLIGDVNKPEDDTIFVVGTGTKTESSNFNTIENGKVTALGDSLYGRDATISAGVPLATDGDALKKLFISNVGSFRQKSYLRYLQHLHRRPHRILHGQHHRR